MAAVTWPFPNTGPSGMFRPFPVTFTPGVCCGSEVMVDTFRARIGCTVDQLFELTICAEAVRTPPVRRHMAADPTRFQKHFAMTIRDISKTSLIRLEFLVRR
jgi:hypothetical protein